MSKEKFHKLLLMGFDIEFDFNEAFYSITTFEDNNSIRFSVANNKKWCKEVDNIEEVDNCLIGEKRLIEIIESIPDEEICY